jgi:isopenicillin-N N-acyltransferase like protein
MFCLVLDQPQHSDPRARGLAHGEAFKKQIHELAQIRRHLLRKYLKNFSVLEIDQLAYDHVLFFKKKEPKLFAEFHGIAEGSNLNLIDLMILNHYTDLRDFTKKGKKQNNNDEGGCSVVSTQTKTNAYCGQTWDMHSSATDYMTLIELKDPKSKQKAAVLTVTGCLALAGVNQSGVTVLINNLHSYETKVALPWPALVRLLLEKPSAKAATTFLKTHLPSSGRNFLICDPKESIQVEVTGKKSEVIGAISQSKPGHLFHTNHYVGKLRKTEILSLQSKTTKIRHESLTRYFSEHSAESMNWETVIQDILCGGKNPGVCIPRLNQSPNDTATCGGMMVDLKNKRSLFFGGTYQTHDHQEIKI